MSKYFFVRAKTICSYLFTFAHICSLEQIDICSSKKTFAHICSHLLAQANGFCLSKTIFAHICSHLLAQAKGFCLSKEAFAHICSHLLTQANGHLLEQKNICSCLFTFVHICLLEQMVFARASKGEQI